jgi:TrmH family RNA methyltransferase
MPDADSPTAQRAGKASASVITSRENRWLKRFRAALSGDRGEDGLVGVEGVRLVEAALGSGLRVEAVLVSDSGVRHLARIAPLLESAVPVLRTTDKLFAGVADTQTPQGIASLVHPRRPEIEKLLRGTALVVVLVGVQDPGNVGTIVRAAESFGATGVATCAGHGVGTADPFSPKALRASAGSALRLPIVHGISSTILLTQLRISKLQVCAAVPDLGARSSEDQGSPAASSALPPWRVDWNRPSAILIGNEGAGLPADLVRSADVRVFIPQAAAKAPVGIESLNAAMAASALLYEAMRQRDFSEKQAP